MRWNGTIEPDANQLVLHPLLRGWRDHVLIVGEQLTCAFLSALWGTRIVYGQAGLNAARSETTVAGLGLVLAFLDSRRKSVYTGSETHARRLSFMSR